MRKFELLKDFIHPSGIVFAGIIKTENEWIGIIPFIKECENHKSLFKNVDSIIEPSKEYYGGEENPYEAIKVIDAWGLDFRLGNVLKYICRAGKKDPSKEIEDLQKAKKYIELKIKQLEGKKDCNPGIWETMEKPFYCKNAANSLIGQRCPKECETCYHIRCEDVSKKQDVTTNSHKPTEMNWIPKDEPFRGPVFEDSKKYYPLTNAEINRRVFGKDFII